MPRTHPRTASPSSRRSTTRRSSRRSGAPSSPTCRTAELTRSRSEGPGALPTRRGDRACEAAVVTDVVDADAATAAVPAPAPGPRRVDVRGLLVSFGVPFTMLACIVFFSFSDDRFASVANLRTLLATGAPLLIVALGLTVVLVMGDFDLSISAMLSAAGAMIVVLIVNHDWS